MNVHNNEVLFKAAMWWRILYGSLRIILGLAALHVIGLPVLDVLTAVMRYELVEDPNDVMYTLAVRVLGAHPLYVSYFLAAYLMFWGILDVFLSYNLLKHRLWAFPASIMLIILFVLYEIVRITHTHSLILLGVICIDGIILWLIASEYRKLRTRVPERYLTRC